MEMTSEQQGKQYKEYLQVAIDLAKEAGEMIKEGQAKRNTTYIAIRTKRTPLDFLTETDLAVENFIRSAISNKYPDHKFIGEEGHVAGSKVQLGDEYTWIVDPIDGTTNFIHGFPFVGCSIGLTHKRQPVVGVVAMPLLGQIFYGRIGGGAFMNGNPLPLTGKAQPLKDLSACCVCLQWGSNRTERHMGTKLANVRRLAMDVESGGKEVHAVRIVGCTTGALMLLAGGSVDVFQDMGSQPWDVCASMVILSESGAFICGSKTNFKQGKKESLGEIMLGRKYCFVRAVAPTETETSEQIQRRIAEEIYEGKSMCIRDQLTKSNATALIVTDEWM